MYRDFGVNPVNLTKPREGRGTWHGKDFRLAKVWISEPRLSRSDRAGSRELVWLQSLGRQSRTRALRTAGSVSG